MPKRDRKPLTLRERAQHAASVTRALRGWKLVPVEPTEAMFNAVIDLGGRASFEDEYKAALAAAPEAPR